MLKLNHINKSFRSHHGIKPVLRDISLEIAAGDRILITGESGCGKTTLLNIIAGIIPPDFGSLIFEDDKAHQLNVTGESMRAKYRFDHIGMIPQGLCLISRYTAINNVCFSLNQHHISKEKAEKKAFSTLKIMNIENIADEPVTRLSMGQKQRVSIARAVALEPSIILADEPTSALDHSSAQLALDVLNQTASTLIIVSHDKSVASICSHIYELENGTLKIHK